MMHLIKSARVQEVSGVMHFIEWLNTHRTREGGHQKNSARHLSILPDTDAKEIHRAMMADDTKVHGISVTDIYKATMRMKMPAEIMNKVESSIGRMYFAVSHPNCNKRKLMYTWNTVRVHWERADATRILVPWIPQGAKVKAIGPDALYEVDTKDPESLWLRKQHTLRGQLIRHGRKPTRRTQFGSTRLGCILAEGGGGHE